VTPKGYGYTFALGYLRKEGLSRKLNEHNILVKPYIVRMYVPSHRFVIRHREQ
jgi:hypothetical protein